MALFFNINNLELEAQGNPDKLIALLTYDDEGKTLNSKNAVIETMNKRKIIKVKRRTINLAII